MRTVLLLVVVLVGSLILWALFPGLWPLWVALGLTMAVLTLGLSIAQEMSAGYMIPVYAALFAWVGVLSGALAYNYGDKLLAVRLLPASLSPLLSIEAPQLSRVLTSILMGVWTGASAVGGLLLLLTLTNYQRLRPTTEQTRSGTFARALRRALALVPMEWELRGGKLEVVRAPKSPHPERMGPGELHVQQGHLAILERDGVISGIKGTGIHWVRPMERIAMCVPLYGRGSTVTVNDAETGDGVKVEALEINVFHKLSAENGHSVVENGGFPYAPAVIKEKVWSPTGNDWSEAVVAITRREAIKLIGQHTLSSFLTLIHGNYNAFKAQLEEQINAVTLNHLGVRVSVTGIGKVQLPAAVVQALTEAALWDIQREIEYDRARIEGAITEEVAQHRRNAFMLMFGALHDATQLHPDVGQLLKMALLERLEREGLGDRRGEGSGQREDVDSLLKLLALDVLRGLPAEGSAADLKALGGGGSRPEGDGPEPSHGPDGSPHSDGEG